MDLTKGSYVSMISVLGEGALRPISARKEVLKIMYIPYDGWGRLTYTCLMLLFW